MKLRVLLKPSEDDGFTAFIPALPGCISEGNSREEALNNIEEAAKLYLEPVEDDENFAANAGIVELAV